MKRILGYGVVTSIIILGGVWVAAQVDLTSFQPGTVIRAAEVNANFEALRDAVAGVVTGLNGKSGNVEIEAGPNITVDNSQAGTIVISAVAGGGGTPATLATAIGRVTDFEGNAGSPSIAGGSANFTVAYNEAFKRYEISFDGASYSIDDLAIVTPATGTGDVRIASVSSVDDQLLVFIRDLSGTDVRDSFHFAAYLN